MKESKFIKTVTDRQMPDLEAIRENCINQTAKKQSKARIISFGSSRFVAVAAVSALALVGMVAALAMPGGLIFPKSSNKPVITMSDVPSPSETGEVLAETGTSVSAPHSSSSGSGADNGGNGDENKPTTSTERCILRMQNAGYVIDELYDLGKAGDYHVCLAKFGDSNACPCEYIIGDYVFRTDARYSPYGLALFAVGHEQTYTLSDAYSFGIFGDDFDDAVELVRNADKTGDFSVEVDDNGDKEVRFREIFDNPDALTLANLGTVGETEIFFTLPETLVDGDSEARIGDYILTLNGSQEVNPHGLFVVYYDEVYTLDEALELGIVDDLDAVMQVVLAKKDVVDYNWSIVEPQPQADDNIEPTQSTEDITETSIE